MTDVNNNQLTDVGDEINYAFDVSNTGNVTLSSVTVTDGLLTANDITVTCAPSSLAPGDSVTCTADAPYVITQADVDAGSVQNSATATGTPPTGPPTTTPPSKTDTPTDQKPRSSWSRRSDKTTLVAGQTITYTFTATNTGNTSLSNVTISEGAFSGSGSMSGLTCTPTQPATLAPKDTLVCTATYVVKQADVDAGTITNHASVVGTPPKGPDVTSTDTVTVPGTSTPGMTLLKRVSSVTDVNHNQLTDVGTITYAFDVSNTGNVTLNPVTVTDDLLTANNITVTCAPDSLAPGESVTCTAGAPYVITQADVDAGGVENSATATGIPPTGPPTTTPPSKTDTPTDQKPWPIKLVKTADKTTLVAGQTMTYTFTATNTGNTSLSNVTISEGSLLRCRVRCRV